MTLTIENYFSEFKNYLDVINSDSSYLATHDFIVKATKKGTDFNAYYSGEKTKSLIDLYFQKLVRLKAEMDKKGKSKEKGIPEKTAKKPPAPKTVKAAPAKKAAAPKATAAKAAKSKVETDAIPVEHIPSDIALVKRYIGLHDKDKTYDQMLSIWRAFNKAIVERKVTKDSPYKSEIATMNSSLKAALAPALVTGSIHLDIPAAKLKVYKAIGDSVEKSAGVSIMLEFINISGKVGMKERADKLGKRIAKAIDTGKLTGDRYWKEIKKAQLDIAAYLNSETDKVNLNDYALSGIGDIAVLGCNCDKELSGFNRSQNAVVVKLIQEKVKNLQDDELIRAFNDTVAPSICKMIAKKLMQTRQLTMALIRNPAQSLGDTFTYDGPPNHKPKTFDFGTEIMDMRLRNAGKSNNTAINGQAKHKGLSGVAETPSYEPEGEEVKIMSASDLVKQKFKTIGLQGKYRKLIGDPEPGFSAMIYGKPKQGKSTVAIDFAKDLTKLGKVLYVAFEEGQGYTLQDKVIRNNADVPGLDFANKLPATLAGYRYVFIDSVTDAGFDETTMRALIKANKPHEISIIGVFHATKAGTFRGGQTFAHDVDMLIRVEDGMVYAQGRYAPPNEISIAELSPALKNAA